MDAAINGRKAAEDAAAEEDRRVAGLQRAAADRREGLARLHGQVNALKSRAAAADDEIGRLRQARAEAQTRLERAQRDFTALETRVAGLDAGEEGLDAEHEAAVSILDDLDERLAKAREEATQADRERSSLAARKDALEMGLNRKDGAGALLAASDSVSGLLGSVAALLSVRTGFEAAIAGALGSAADAVAVTDAEAALGAIEHLKSDDLGRAGILLGGSPAADADWPGLPGDATYAVDVVECPAELRPALTRLLFKIAVVDDLPAARALVAEASDVTAVTRAGDVLGAHFASGGSSAQPSLIEVQAAVDEAAAQLAEATAAGERLTFETSRMEAERLDAQKRVDVALAKLHESDATLAAVAEELGQYGSQARAARGEADRLESAIAKAEEAHERDLAGLAELETRLAAAEDSPEEEPDTTERERLTEAARAARQGEMDARLALRTSEERARALHGRADALLRSARQEREARARAAERRERMIREGRAAEAVGLGVGIVLGRLDASIGQAAAGPHRGRAGPRRPRGRAAHHPQPAARPRPRARRAGQLRPPRRDGPHPAADAHRAARGAGARGARARPRGARQRLRPREPRAVLRRGRGGRRDARAHAVRPRGAGQAAPLGRAVAHHARQGQPAGARGVLGDGGAAQVPHRAARGPQEDPHATSSTSSARSTPGWSRSSPRPGRTSGSPSTTSSRGCSPAARAS